MFKIPFLFLRLGALNEMQYRVNFFLQLMESLIALIVGLVGLSIVFEHTTDLAGWSRAELLVVMGVHTLMGGILRSLIQPNMQRLMNDIQQGTLDFALTKPADSQLMVSVREFRIWKLVDVLVGIAIITWGLLDFHTQVGWAEAFIFLGLLLLGASIIYAFWLILTTIAFWVVRIDEITDLFQGLYAAGRWPISIYPDWLRSGLTFLVPVAFAVTIPAEALVGRLTLETLGLTALVTVLFAVGSRFFFKFGLKSYTGASA